MRDTFAMPVSIAAARKLVGDTFTVVADFGRAAAKRLERTKKDCRRASLNRAVGAAQDAYEILGLCEERLDGVERDWASVRDYFEGDWVAAVERNPRLASELDWVELMVASARGRVARFPAILRRVDRIS